MTQQLPTRGACKSVARRSPERRVTPNVLVGESSRDNGGAWFLVVWAALGSALLGLSLWGLLYREELVVDDQVLTDVRGIGRLARRRSYLRSGIEDLRISAEAMSPFDPRAGLRMYGVGGGTIAFDYGDRTARFGDVEAEAKRVIAALKQEGLDAGASG